MTDEVPGPVPDAQRRSDDPAPGADLSGGDASGVAPDVGPVPATRTFGALTYVGLVVGGVFMGVLGVGLAAVRTQVRGTFVPWGLVLMLVALPVCVRGAAWVVGSRRGAAAVAIGWVLPTIAFASTSPGGDVLLPDLRRTYIYLVGGAVLVLLASVWPLPRGLRAYVREGVVGEHPSASEPQPTGSDGLEGLQG